MPYPSQKMSHRPWSLWWLGVWTWYPTIGLTQIPYSDKVQFFLSMAVCTQSHLKTWSDACILNIFPLNDFRPARHFFRWCVQIFVFYIINWSLEILWMWYSCMTDTLRWLFRITVSWTADERFTTRFIVSLFMPIYKSCFIALNLRID